MCVPCINLGGTGNELPIWIGNHPLRPSEMTHLTFGSEVRLMKGGISDNNLSLLRSWVALNLKVLQEHWNGEIDSADLIERVRRI